LAAKFTFYCTSDDRRRALPRKVLFGLGPNEAESNLVLKFIGWVLFYRDRLQVQTELPDDSIPFVPDLVELGYDLRPLLWVEGGESSPAKLQKIAVKCPDAQIWVVKSSPAEVDALRHTMKKEEFRRDRYGLIGLEPEMFAELAALIRERNQFHWFAGGFADEPGLEENQLQFELNGLWFDHSFTVARF
jgi:uncharacterized protein YaeQ